MGFYLHHAILVTSNLESIEIAWQYVRRTGVIVSDISDAHANGFRSFAVFPDGSKEGWRTSDDGDVLRKSIVDYLRTMQTSGLAWVEVSYGGDEPKARIEAESEE